MSDQVDRDLTRFVTILLIVALSACAVVVLFGHLTSHKKLGHKGIDTTRAAVEYPSFYRFGVLKSL
jgi:hypothetical protein